MFFNRKAIAVWVPALLAVLSTAVFLSNPEQVFQAASTGVEIWWKVVFPALMPYFMLTELLLASGLLHFCGRLATPITGPLLGLPGSALWALFSGWIGGYPAGAKATAVLSQQGIIQKQQSERLLALSHAAAPALIATVIAVGFFRMPQLALPLLLIHWGSLLAMAVLLAWLVPQPRQAVPESSESLWKQARLDMQRARQEDGRSLGQLLGDTVKHAIEQLFAIGGILIFCSVAAAMLRQLLPPLHTAAGEAWISALLEVHLGARQLADMPQQEVKLTMAAIGALLGFSGLSMLLQVRALVARTGIRFRIFFYSRLMHAALAFGLTLVIWEPLLRFLQRTAIPALASGWPVSAQGGQDMESLYVWAVAAPALSAALFGTVVACSALLLGVKRAGHRLAHLFRRF
ncbi:hypothetical protein DUZ99_03955 [Xylanibacillus composti]|uniref:Sporulation integral membrane protein YlbJ n=1 Tax=Xylanibacillus composti TaxID=1572762 RepID=A0A8J4M226_9BACL|nr:nucleoside recognition domain-containing protein [Xylanibacillus composti]MDT9724140.1 hypothetical protein [Xylanibacillus composti]GIQ68690.1 sporulation integral membrane protein YlbJ [Xylanibacillus composti]